MANERINNSEPLKERPQQAQEVPAQREAQDPQQVREAVAASFSDDPQARAAVTAAADRATAAIGKAVTGEELEQLMQLPLSQIETLPQEKQDIIWRETAQQIAEIPGIFEAFKALGEIGREIKKLSQEIAGNLAGVSLDGTREAAHLWKTLAPYMREEKAAHPEKYSNAHPAGMDELIAAAAQRARADGKEIPSLKAETTAEPEAQQMEMQLDLPDETIKEDTPAALVERLKKIPVLNPQAHIMPNNALMNVLQQSGAINAGEFALLVAPENSRRKEITAYTMIEYDPGEAEETGITITDPKVTEYERNVSNAIVSLWVEAEKQGVEPVFTTDAIYRAMPGGGEAASPQQKGAITKAVEKFRRIHMTVDATEELIKRGAINKGDSFKIDESYFQMTRAKRTSKHSGQSVTAYKLTEKPVILKYAEMTRQILSVPARHLSIRKIDKAGRISTELIATNAERQAITGYMLRRIAVMKHDLEAARDRKKQYDKQRKHDADLPEKPLAAFKRQSNVILFDTMFANTDTQTDSRTQAQRNREFCADVLEYWKATGLIKGYSLQSKGRKFTGIVIEL